MAAIGLSGFQCQGLVGPKIATVGVPIAADTCISPESLVTAASAAIGTPTVAIFGPTSPWHWKPLNPIAAILEPPGDEAAAKRARTEGNDAVRHRSTADVTVETVLASVREVLRKGH